MTNAERLRAYIEAGIHGLPVSDARSILADLETLATVTQQRDELLQLQRAAEYYVFTKTKHPQASGEAYRDLCNTIESAAVCTPEAGKEPDGE